LRAIGRDVVVVNLDPANDSLPYDCAVDINELVSLDDVVESVDLGPNGGLIFCMEYLEKNIHWLTGKLATFQDKYVLFDLPGQVELFCHHESLKVVVKTLEKLGFQMVAVHLVDSHHCSDANKFLSLTLLSLSTMLHLELPHVNVLSKIDSVEVGGTLAFGLDFYTEVQDLGTLVQSMGTGIWNKQHRKLCSAVAEMVDDFGLVSFTPLTVLEKESMHELVKIIDKTNGYFQAKDSDPEKSNRFISSASSDYQRVHRYQDEFMLSDPTDAGLLGDIREHGNEDDPV